MLQEMRYIDEIHKRQKTIQDSRISGRERKWKRLQHA